MIFSGWVGVAFLTFGVIGFPVRGMAWTLNDVSILLPLPNVGNGDKERLLGTETMGDQGELLPFEVFDQFPNIVHGVDPFEIFKTHLKVVALRIDPCFFERKGVDRCRPQIRMIWQPILEGTTRSFAMDAALHSFYDLTETEWSDLLQDLKSLVGKRSDSLETLGVHPVISEQGLGGEHWSSLKKVILKYAGKNNLSRVTSMSVDTIGSFWAFRGVEIEDGFLRPIEIARAHSRVQSIFVDISNLNEMRMEISPPPENATDWLRLVSHSAAAKGQMSPAAMTEAIRSAIRIENPNFEDSSTVDCVSCHIAQTVRIWGEKNLRADILKDVLKETGFSTANVPLENSSYPNGFSNRLRAFGYFADEPSISQRMIHESALVLDLVKKQVSCGSYLKGGKK